MSARGQGDTDRRSAGVSQGGHATTSNMDIPSRRPPRTSSPKSSGHPTRDRVSGADPGYDSREYSDDDDEDESDVSEKTANTRRVTRGNSFTPESGPYRPFVALPTRPRLATDQMLDRGSRPPGTRLEVVTNHHRSEDSQAPSYGQADETAYDNARDQKYHRSPSNTESSQHYSTTLRAQEQQTKRIQVRMPSVSDFTGPSSVNRPQFREISPRRQQSTPLPSGYDRPSQQNSVEDYEAVGIRSSGNQESIRGSQRPSPTERVPSDARDPHGDRRDGDSPLHGPTSAEPTTPSNRYSYQTSSPRDTYPPGVAYPASPGSAPRSSYDQSPSDDTRIDPYPQQVINATRHQSPARASDRPTNPQTRPINIPPMPPRPSRLSVSSQGYGGYGHSPNTPNSATPKSPLGQMPVRTRDDGLDGRRQSCLSPTTIDGRQTVEDNYFASRSPASFNTEKTARPEPVYRLPSRETNLPPVKSDGPVDEQLILERKRQVRVPSSPGNSIMDIRPDNHRRTSTASDTYQSPREGTILTGSRPGDNTDSRSQRETEVNARIKVLQRESESLRGTRDKALDDWYTRMNKQLPNHLAAVGRELGTSFTTNRGIQDDLQRRGWNRDASIKRNQVAIEDIYSSFTKKYNSRVEEIFNRYKAKDEGFPRDTVSIVAWSRIRDSKAKGGRVDETDGLRINTEVTLSMAGTDPIIIQRRQSYNDLTKKSVRASIPTTNSRRLEQPGKIRSEYDSGKDDRDRRPKQPVNRQDTRNDEYNDDQRITVTRGRERTALNEEVPRKGELVLLSVNRSDQRGGSRGSNESTRYKYDTSRTPSRAPSREPPRRVSRTASRAPSQRTRVEDLRRESPRRRDRSRRSKSRKRRTESEQREKDAKREERKGRRE